MYFYYGSKEDKSGDFIKQFNWQKNVDIVSSRLESILKEDKSILISDLSVEEEDNDYYISIVISFEHPNICFGTNTVRYYCYMNKNKYRSSIPLYTAPCEKAGHFDDYSLNKFTITNEERKKWSNVDDIINFLIKNISIDISKLKDRFGFEDRIEEKCETTDE